MAQFSRRQFLHLAGVTLLAAHLPGFAALAEAAASAPAVAVQQGRTLLPASVHARPSADAAVVGRLWPDSIVPLADASAGWYRTAGGFVERGAVQPVARRSPTEAAPAPAPPFWAEVAGPVAAVRRWCAADAPLVARIGHGGTAQVVAAPPPGAAGGPPWYGLADGAGALLGWTQTAQWRPVRPEAEGEGAALRLEIARRDSQLTVFVGERPALRAPVAAGARLEPGRYPLRRARVAGPPLALVEYGDGALYGAPWQLDLGGQYWLTGAYWHNRFGGWAPGPDVQVPPFLARWLYAQTGPGSAADIR